MVSICWAERLRDVKDKTCMWRGLIGSLYTHDGQLQVLKLMFRLFLFRFSRRSGPKMGPFVDLELLTQTGGKFPLRYKRVKFKIRN